MPSPAAAFKVARDAALKASAALATAAGGLARVFTDPPTNLKPPYVLTGEDQVLLESSVDCGDEAELFSTIHLWSRTEPRDGGLQARQMGAAIIDVMLGELVVSGWDVDLAELVDERYVTDPDGSTHGVLTLRHMLTLQAETAEPAPAGSPIGLLFLLTRAA